MTQSAAGGTKIPHGSLAQQVTVTGWQCWKCHRWYGNGANAKSQAEYCCATHHPCACGGDAPKGYSACDACRDKQRIERFYQLEAKDYDGSPLFLDDSDEFFLDEDALKEFIADLSPEDRREIRLRVSRPVVFGWDNLAEHFQDELCEGQEWDTSDIDTVIAEWLKENAPKNYVPDKFRVSEASIAQLVAEVEQE